MGFLDALSATITPALQYRTGQMQGAQQKEEKERSGFLEQLKLMRQQQEDALNTRLKNAQLANTEKQTELMGQKAPRTVKEGEDGSYYSVDEATGNALPVTREAPYTGVVPPEQGQGPQDPSAPRPRQILKGKVKAENPVVGSQAWKDAETFKAGLQPKQEPLVPVQQDDGTVIYTPRSQAAGQKAPAKSNARGVATIRKAIAANQEQVSVIDDALNELAAYPEAIGLNRGIGDLPLMGKSGDAINQRVDPQGVAARAALANIASMVIHDRSGAAVTVSEFPRLAPFVPSVHDTYDTAVKKLQKLKTMIGVETGALQSSGTSPAPAAPASTSTGDIDLSAPSGGGKTFQYGGKTYKVP